MIHRPDWLRCRRRLNIQGLNVNYFLFRSVRAKLPPRRPSLVVAIGFGWAWLCLVGPVSGQAPSGATTGVDKAAIVDCKLPPQSRKLNSSTTTLTPGGVEKLSRDECESRGGSYEDSVPADAPPMPDKGEPVVAPESPSKASVMDAQKQLRDLGFDLGAPDGIMGSKTIAALRRFQIERHLPPTGKLDNATLLELKKSTRPVDEKITARLH
jgi:hypothetical protein